MGVALIFFFGWFLFMNQYPFLDERLQNFAKFCFFGSLFSGITVCGTYPIDRLLSLVGFGGSGLVAVLILLFAKQATEIRKSKKISLWKQPQTAKSLLKFLLLVHVVLSFLLFPFRSGAQIQFSRDMEHAAKSISRIPNVNDRTVIILNCPKMGLVFYSQLIQDAQGLSIPKHLQLLSVGENSIQIERVSDNQLKLSPTEGFQLGIFNFGNYEWYFEFKY